MSIMDVSELLILSIVIRDENEINYKNGIWQLIILDIIIIK